MFCRLRLASRGFAVLACAIMFLSAGPAPAAEVPQAATTDQLDLSSLERPVPPDASAPVPSTSAAPDAVPVPLPPALGTGLVGLATVAVLHVGRRVYRRR